jgi:acetyl-CoA synthetase
MADDDSTPMDHRGSVGDADAAAVFPPPPAVAAGAHCPSLDAYQALYARSIANPAGFWGDMAREYLSWFRDFKEV